MRPIILLILLLLAPALYAQSSAAPATQPAPAPAPAAQSIVVPANTPLLEPVAQVTIDLDVALTLQVHAARVLPGGRTVLLETQTIGLDVGMILLQTSPWWVGGPLGLLWLLLAWRFWRRWRRRHSADVGMEQCRRCGYCLQGVTSDSCPECGAALTKSNRVIRRSLRRPAVFLAVSFALAAGSFPAVHFLAASTRAVAIANRLHWYSPSLWNWTDKTLGYDLREKLPAADVKRIVEFDLSTGRQTRTIAGPGWNTNTAFVPPAMLLSPDGSRVLYKTTFDSGPGDHLYGCDCVFNLSTGERTILSSFTPGEVHCFSLDSQSIFHWARGKAIVRHDIATGKSSDAVAPPENGLFISASMWPVAPDRLLTTYDRTYDPAGPKVDYDLWDLSTRRVVSHGEIPSFPPQAILLAEDRLYVVCTDSTANDEAGHTVDIPGSLTAWGLSTNPKITTWRLDWSTIEPCGHGRVALSPPRGVQYPLPQYGLILDTDTGKVLARLKVGETGSEFVSWMAYDSLHDRLYVANFLGPTFTFDLSALPK